jgi:GDP-L-fucose synthase
VNSRKKIYIAGHRGLVGSAIWRHLQTSGFTNLVGLTSNEIDLRDREKTIKALSSLQPDIVIIAAAKVGGIGANSTQPVAFLNDNQKIQANILEASHLISVERLLFLGSSCIYPKFAPQPIKEEYLLTGGLEETNISYAIAKISGLINVKAYRSQYQHDWISAMPTNLYGPNDNYDLQNSHVLPALIRKFHEAKEKQKPFVELWGDGSPMREFLHVDDLAKACIFLLNEYHESLHINIGTGVEISIQNLSHLIAKKIGFTGDIKWDTSKPNGTPRKILDSSRINNLGWKSEINLDKGIESTYIDFKSSLSTSQLF